jgi:hypothetical protein
MTHTCNAFDTNQDPCFRSVPTERGVCEDHYDYYESNRWFCEYPLNIQTDDLDYFASSSDKLKKVYKKAILGGFITITQSHFNDLINSGRPIESLVDYYLLCCMQPGIDPLWSVRLFKQVAREIIMCHHPSVYQLVQKDSNFLYKFLDPLFNNTTRSFDSMLFNLLINIALVNTSWSRNTCADCILNPKVSLIQYIQDHPLYTMEFAWKYSEYDLIVTSLLNRKNPKEGSIANHILKFILSIPEKRRSIRESHKAAFKEKANEIIEHAWAPERVLNWCLDVEEQGQLKNRWLII